MLTFEKFSGNFWKIAYDYPTWSVDFWGPESDAYSVVLQIKKAVNRFSNLKIHLATLFMKSGLSEGFVPSKQVCQWFLVKLQTASQLLHRIKECSFYSFDMLHRRLRTGHCWIELVVAMAMISRIR